MKFRRILTILIIILVVYFSTIFVMKNYIYPYKYSTYIEKYSKNLMDPYLILAVIKTESNFNKEAESKKGAKGLMQIMDGTGEWAAKELGINYFCLLCFWWGIKYKNGMLVFANLEDEFGNRDLVLAAYNGGSGNVNKWLNDEDYSSDGETLITFHLRKLKICR